MGSTAFFFHTREPYCHHGGMALATTAALPQRARCRTLAAALLAMTFAADTHQATAKRIRVDSGPLDVSPERFPERFALEQAAQELTQRAPQVT
jgi:hypothetical protein